MKQLFLYSAIAIFAASCASQKYSRTDNITDDVYFSPSSAQKESGETPAEPEDDGFHYETGSNTPNPNASYYRYQATGANTNQTSPVPDSTQLLNYSNPSYTTVTNNYYGNTYNPAAFGYSPWGMNQGFGCQPGFGMNYSPHYGWGWGMSYSYSPYGFYSPYGACYNGWGSNYGYSPYYGYTPYYGYSPWYGYSQGYGNYNPYNPYPYQITPGNAVGGTPYTNQPRLSRGSILPSTPSGNGTGRGRAPIITEPVKPVHRPGNQTQPNSDQPVLRGSEGAPAVKPQDGEPVLRTKPTPATPDISPSTQPQRPEARPVPTPAPVPQPRPEARPAPQPQRPEARPQPAPTPQQRPEARPAPQPQRPEARPAPAPRPQVPSPQPSEPSRQPNVNPSPSPSPSPSQPSGNGGSAPQRRR